MKKKSHYNPDRPVRNIKRSIINHANHLKGLRINAMNTALIKAATKE